MASQVDKNKFLDPNADERTLLLFTGGQGEPKCIDVERCIEDLDASADISNLGAFNENDKLDFTDACPRVPLSPITFYFTNDPARTASSFRGSRGVQFSYQAIYKKGFLSALAPYSNVAVPPSILNGGKKAFSEIEFENTCVLEIPKQSAEVEGIRLVVREGNDGIARKIQDIYFGSENQNFVEDNGPFSNYAGLYEYFNDITGSIINETDRLKTFDAVPRDAKAQEIAGDRLLYGNYTDGYSNIQTDCRLEVSFSAAPPPGYSFDIDAIPVLFRRNTGEFSDTTLTPLDTYDPDSRRYLTSAGILLDDAGLPDMILPGVYEYTVNMSPTDNFHQFLGHNDSPNSTENVNLTELATEHDLDDYSFGQVAGSGIAGNWTYGGIANTQPSVDDVYMPKDTSPGANSTLKIRNFASSQYRYDGPNSSALLEGVGLALDAINQTVDFGTPKGSWVSTGGSPQSVGIGESYTCPLIYKGGNLSFSATLTLESEVPKEEFMNSLVHALWGLPPSNNPIVGFNGVQNYPISDEEWFATHSFDLGLSQDGIQADTISQEDDDRSNLIFAVGTGDEVASGGYAIINKALMNFCLEPARGSAATKYFGETQDSSKYNFEDDQGNTRTLWGLKLTLANVQDVDIKTCIPDPVSQFGSLISQQAFESVQTGYESFDSDLDRFLAQTFNARATDKWDYDVLNGECVVAWPSIERNLSIPRTTSNGGNRVDDVTAYGPANQCFDTPNNSGGLFDFCFVDYVTDDNGIAFPSAGSMTNDPLSGFGNSANAFRPRQTLYSDTYSNPGSYPHDWMPAPIEKWYVFDDPTTLTSTEWKELYGYSSRMTVDDGFVLDGQFKSPIIQGRPRTLIKGISENWEGYLTDFNVVVGNREYFRYGLTVTTRPTTGDIFTLTSNSPFSLVDGAMGPGGSAYAGTRALGERGTSQDEGWGCFLDMGNHDLNNINKSISGRYANIRGSVTSFSLIGYVDNHPGYLLQNVSKKSVTEDKNTSFQRYSVCNKNGGAPFNNHPPRYYVSSGSIDPSVIKESKGPILPYTEGSVPPLQTYTTLYGMNIAEVGGQLSSFLGGSGAGYLKSIAVPFTGGSNGSALGQVDALIGSDNNSTGGRSFKTKANHEFGIVYFDGKGRHGAVQPVGSVYVPGYDKERVSNQFGAATVKIFINHAPPSWAKNYRIVYAGNTSIEEFNQFSIANAFVPSENVDAGKIYLSLSHLQSHPISYTDSYGAVSQQDGSDRIYRFAPGDVLRIINYSDSTGERIYLSDPYEYKVLGVENLTSTMEDHPLYVGNVATNDAEKNGEFLIIENNAENAGFTAAEVATGSSFWGDRCIVEVYRPKRNIGEDSPYYETNYGGRVFGEGDSKTHQYNTITMTRGDIYYRAVPINLQNINGGVFESLIQGTVQEDTSTPNFVPVFLETDGYTDFYISNTHDYGRVHFVDRDASEVKRKYSITFSESTFLGSFQPRWLSFPQIGNFKDYSFDFGEIDLLDFDGQFINSFHSNRILKIPFQRNVLSTGDTDQVVSSTKVLGTEAVLPIESGSSGRPESIIKIDGDYFFFDSDKKRVVMLKGGKSPQIITDFGVRNYFKTKVDKWLRDEGYRASMGYDPRNSELIISLSKKRDNQETDFNSDQNKDRVLSMGFDLVGKKGWKSRYSFASSLLAYLGENMYSFHKGSKKYPAPFMHDESAQQSSFYGKSYGSSLTSVMAGNPTEIKEFNAIILDSNSPWTVNVKSGDQEQLLDSESFKFFNDRFYRPIDGSVPTSQDLLDSVRPVVVSTFPNDAHRGVRAGKNIELMRRGNALQFRFYMPSDHHMFKSSIPLSQGSSLVELNQSGELVPLGTDPRNASVYDREYFVSKIADDYDSGCTYVEFTAKTIQTTDIQFMDNTVNPNGEFVLPEGEFVSLDSISPLSSGYVSFFQSTIQPLISSYIFGPSYNTGLETPFSNQGANMSEYDEDGDGFVSVSDIEDAISGTPAASYTGFVELCLASFVDQYDQNFVSVDLANRVVDQAQIIGYNKTIYSTYKNAKEAILGRNLEIQLSSDASGKGDELFSIEVDYNSRNKKLSAPRPATKAKKK